MNSVTDFYDKLDLKYPEIGICIDKIDRIKPGKRRFIIPILTPNLDIENLAESKIHQTADNIMNKEKNIEVEDIDVCNYVEIQIPKELCCICDGPFKIIEDKEKSIIDLYDSTSPNISNAHQSGIGGVSCEAGTISVSGRVSGDKLTFTDGMIKGFAKIEPDEEIRYIEEGSKWIIVFLGGDITKPMVVARCPYEDGSEETTEES